MFVPNFLHDVFPFIKVFVLILLRRTTVRGCAIIYVINLERTVISTRVEEIHDRLAAFFPAYTDQGSVTRLIYGSPDADQEACETDQRQVENVKRALARCYAVDLPAQGKLLRERYSRGLPLHFYLPDGRVFVPFKLRELRVQGDASYGYADLDQIERLVPGQPPRVLLRSGTCLPIFSNIQTARLSMFFAMEIKSDLVPPPDAGRSLAAAVEILRGLIICPTAADSPRPGMPLRFSDRN